MTENIGSIWTIEELGKFAINDKGFLSSQFFYGNPIEHENFKKLLLDSINQACQIKDREYAELREENNKLKEGYVPYIKLHLEDKEKLEQQLAEKDKLIEELREKVKIYGFIANDINMVGEENYNFAIRMLDYRDEVIRLQKEYKLISKELSELKKNRLVALDEIRQIVIEDVPHKYQNRILTALNSKRG